MESIKNALSSIFLILLIVAGISLYNTNKVIDMQDEEIEVLIEEISKADSRVDSMSTLLQIERSKYDSLCSELDSSEIRYNNIIKRYKVKKEKVKYLNADESINFLHHLIK